MTGLYAEGKVFFAGGYSQTNSPFVASNAVDIYDIQTGQWTSDTLSSAMAGIGATVLGNKLLFAGGTVPGAGGTFQNVSVMDIYDLATQTWSTVSMPGDAVNLSAVSIGNKAYFLQGNSNSSLGDIWVYDGDTGNWSEMNLPLGHRIGLTAGAVGDNLLCAGGQDPNDFYNETKRIEIFNTVTQQWSNLNLYKERYLMSAQTIGDKVYFIGGESGISATNDVDIFDNTTGQMTHKTMSYQHANHAVGALGNYLMIGGGDTISTTQSKVEVFDTDTTVWGPSVKYTFPGGEKHYYQAGVSTPIGVFFAGGEINTINFIEDKVSILQPTVGTETHKVGQLLLVPTVAAEYTTLKLPEGVSTGKPLLFEVTDLYGRLRLSEMVSDAINRIEVSGFPAGSYFVRLTTPGKIWTGRFIKL